MKEITFYIIVGTIGSFIDFGAFIGLKFAGLSTISAQWIAALLGNTHNHLWQFYKIFDHNQSFKKTYALTLLLAGILILVSGPLLVYIDQFINNLFISKVLLFPSIGFIGYLIRKNFIYHEEERLF